MLLTTIINYFVVQSPNFRLLEKAGGFRNRRKEDSSDEKAKAGLLQVFGKSEAHQT